MFIFAACCHPDDHKAITYAFDKLFKDKAKAIDYFVNEMTDWEYFKEYPGSLAGCQTAAREAFNAVVDQWSLPTYLSEEMGEVFTLNECEE